MPIASLKHTRRDSANRRKRLAALIDEFEHRRILVIGDVIADEFIYGDVSRVSREAPVLILKYSTSDLVPGGAGNAAANVAALGGHVALAGLVGADDQGRRLLSLVSRVVDVSRVARVRHYQTPVKTRVLAGGIHSAKQQVVRIDRDQGCELGDKVVRAFAKAILTARRKYHAVLLSDYGTGLVTPTLAKTVQAAVSRQSTGGIPVLIDSRYRLLDHHRLTMCTPNESEVEQALGVRIDDDKKVLEWAGRELLRRTGMSAVLITRGSRGMALFQPRKSTVHIPIHGSDEVTDVTGAGDTVIATCTLALSAGGSFEEAARLANYAGGLVVMKRGTATVTADELRAAVAGRQLSD